MKESDHDNCYLCERSLIEDYDDGVGIIKDKDGVHFVCGDCADKIKENQKKKH